MEKYYLLRIELADITPAIWRRIVVPAAITLDRLHDVIQIVMDWEEQHLHQFSYKKRYYLEMPETPEEENEAAVRLNQLLTRRGATLHYMYDFGDSWLHTLTLEHSNYPEQELLLPIFCLDGERAGPPEDCGGAAGYANLLAAVADPQSEEHGNYCDWLGLEEGQQAVEAITEIITFFSADEVNEQLALYLRWSRDRQLPLFEK